jgi:transposase
VKKVIKLNDKANILIKHFVEGQSIRKISRESEFSRNTIRKYIRDHDEKLQDLDKAKSRDEILTLIESLVETPEYDSSNRNKYKMNEAIKKDIAYCIRENKKRRATGRRKLQRKKIDIHEYLLGKGHDISYSTVCNYIRNTYENAAKEAYIKQLYHEGESLQFDYGEANLEIAGKNKTLNMALFTTGFGFHHYGKFYANKKMTSFLDAHVKAFENFNGVYHEVVYDNLKQAVKRFVGPSEKEATEDLVKLSLYYGFKYRFCNAYRGNEKGKVEKGVDFVRRRIFSQKTSFESIEEANAYLAAGLKRLNSMKKAKLDNKSPYELWQQEIPYLLPLKPPYEACREKECRVNKYSFVTFEQNKYSVPDHLVGRFVNSRIYSDYIKIYYNDELVAKHQRIYEVHKCSIEIEHYLLTLKRKPGALKNSLAFHQMAPDLKEIYELYYDNYTRKTKEFIELLELVSEKGLDEIKGAIETLSKNKKSMVTTANIKVLVQKENTPDFTISSEINENSLELLKKWDTMFSLQNHQEVIQ